MRRLRLFYKLLMLAVFLAACAPGTSTVAPVQPATDGPDATATRALPEVTAPAVDLTATYMLEPLSATPPAEAQPVATSRGPDLHATDPTTVSLASGGLQFVEFFRFT